MTDQERAQLERRAAGKSNKVAGSIFEQRIERSLNWYTEKGLVIATKTPEPMKVIRPLAQGRFTACFVKKAQVDFSGTMKGGQAVRFEAKETMTDRFTQDRVTPEQQEDLRRHGELGAFCFVLLSFGLGSVYRVPWQLWINMKEHFGHKYVTESDLKKYIVPEECGILKIFV